MWLFLRKLSGRGAVRRFYAKARAALALNRRGEARADGLTLVESSMRLEVKWRARKIHPWDRDLSEDRAAPRYVEQALFDTEAALERLFATFPEVTCIDFAVLETRVESTRTIIAGVVDKKEFGDRKSPSIGMRLRSIGIEYHIVGSHFAPLYRAPRGGEEVRVSVGGLGAVERHGKAGQEFSAPTAH
jgi:hypothetical protein